MESARRAAQPCFTPLPLGFARPDTAPRYAPDLGIEPTHLDLELGLDIDTRTLEGIASYRQLVQRTHGCRTLTPGRRWLLPRAGAGLAGSPQPLRR